MKRSFLCLFSIVIFTLSTSTALADVVPGSQFCMDHAATCGVWPDAETTCETWWSEAAIGEEGDTAGATQGCYNYHLAVAMEHLALGETETVIAHCAHSIGGEDAEGNAPCVDDEPVVDPPVPYDACDGKVCGTDGCTGKHIQ